MSNDDEELTHDYRATPPRPTTPRPQPSWTPPAPPSNHPPHYAPPPYAEPQYAPPQYAPPTPPAKKTTSLIRWVIAAAVLIVVIAVAAYVARNYLHDSAAPSSGPSAAGPTTPPSGGSTTATTSSLPPIRANQLPGFVPDPTTLASLLGIDKIEQTSAASDDPKLWATKTDHPECAGLVQPGMREAYDGSGFSGAIVQTFRDHATGDWSRSVDQTVAAFPDEKSAQAFIETSAARWAKCKNTTITLTLNPGDTLPFSVADTKLDGNVLTASMLITSYSAGFGCQSELTRRRNVVIDVRACDYGGSAQASTIVDYIATRIPTT